MSGRSRIVIVKLMLVEVLAERDVGDRKRMMGSVN